MSGMERRSMLAMMLKSYGADVAYAARLVESFRRFNRDGIPLFIVVPAEDRPLFAQFEDSTISILDESMFETYLTITDINGYRAGYINQEIVKLAFWESELCDNYFVLDSDAVFLREFTARDFMFDDETPFTFLTEDSELIAEPQYFREYWTKRKEMIMRIPELLNYTPRLFLTSHNHSVFSAKALESFKAEFLDPRGWTYLDAIREVPFEFSWYNMWVQAREPIPLHQREPIVKMYHNETQHLQDVMKGVTSDDLARGYVVAVLNSNYSRGIGVIGVEASKPQALANYVTYSELIRILRIKLARALARRFRKGD
jgi:hypothetical protein